MSCFISTKILRSMRKRINENKNGKNSIKLIGLDGRKEEIKIFFLGIKSGIKSKSEEKLWNLRYDRTGNWSFLKSKKVKVNKKIKSISGNNKSQKHTHKHTVE